MINEQETFIKFGYYSYDLKKKSSKFIIANCDICKKDRKLKKYAYRSVCSHCAKIIRIKELTKQSVQARKGVYKHSDETKQKISEAVSGINNVNYGKHLTESTKRKLAEAHSGKKNHFYGKHHTSKTKELLAEKNSIIKVPYGSTARKKVISTYKRSAKQKNIVFSLNDEQLMHLLSGNCHYCGQEPSNVQKYRNGNFIYNGIDRINNNDGYTEENSVSCCNMCNRAKRNISYDNFIAWIKKAYRHLHVDI